MGKPAVTQFALVADIGGTHARFALVQSGSFVLQAVTVLPCANFDIFGDALSCYLQQQDRLELALACFAMAGPVHTDAFKMTNNHWYVVKADIRAQLPGVAIKWMNDFTAQAWAMLILTRAELVVVNQAPGQSQRARLVIGAGTGLGICTLVPTAAGWLPVIGEGGHIDFAPNSILQADVWNLLRRRFGHVSVERIVSGAGLLNLYVCLAELQQQTINWQTPIQITTAALRQQPDLLAQQALKMFFHILGAVAGNAALTVGALGGVYITGGIVPRWVDFLLDSEFLQGFFDKGRCVAYMKQIPVFIAIASHPGLLGAAVALAKEPDSC
jgi:glucokinase